MQTTQHHAFGDSSNRSLTNQKTPKTVDSLASIVKIANSSVAAFPTVFGDYLLHRVLGSGGMGIVYLATQIELERKVAVKMIRNGGLASEREVQRFYTEARSAAALRHPNIVSVYQFGEVDGQHFFAMEFIDGENLADRLSFGPISPPLAAKFVHDLAKAVAYAHSKGIIHRDLKPANILISAGEHVFISDFGLAKVLHSTSNATLDGTALGTPGFMSPEQARGDSQQHGQATDIYSLGAILFASLTGHPPFAFENIAQSIYAVVHHEPPFVRQLQPRVHVDLESIVAKCLCKSPQDRYPSADALAEDLDRFLRSQPVSARPLSSIVRVGRWTRQIPIIAVMTGSHGYGNTAAHRVANNLLVLLLLLFTITIAFRSPIREVYKANVLPANVTLGMSAASESEIPRLQELAERFERKTGQPLTLIDSRDAQGDLDQAEKERANLSLLVATEIEQSTLSVIAPLYTETLHIVVRDSIAGKNITDLKGLRIAIGEHGSVAHQVVESLRKSVPELFADLLCVEMNASELFQRDDLDAAVVIAKHGSTSIRSMLSSSYHLVGMEAPANLHERIPGIVTRQVDSKAGDLHGTRIATIDIPIFIAVHPDASNKLVRTIVESLDGTQQAINHLADRESFFDGTGLPIHPAAKALFGKVYLRSAEKSRHDHR